MSIDAINTRTVSGNGRKYEHLSLTSTIRCGILKLMLVSLCKTLYEELQLKSIGVYDFELFYKNYLAHNERLWERYRKGYIKQEELRVKKNVAGTA